MGASSVDPAFAMADIAGSAQLWNRYPDMMSEALDRHDRLAGVAVTGSGGEIFKHTGDGFLAWFADVAAAVESMVGYQRALAEMSRRGTVEIRSRVCIHRGPGEQRHDDWFGPTINHLARLTDLVAPTHVVLSAAASDQLGESQGRLDHLGVFSVRDVPGPVSLYAVPLSDAVGPALTVAAGRGLVQYRTSFVGRDRDVLAVSALLDRHRLVTVCGFGGMGKTRLAVEVSQRWAERHGAPAHFVDLASADDPMVAIAAAVGVSDGLLGAAASVLDVITHHLGDRTVLLLVDNCEHVIAAAAEASDALLDASASLRILATSREAMELDGEAVYALGSLDPDAALDLLRQRTASVGVDDVSDRIARRLCERVERMPLGIELVVSRLRQVGPVELADALDQSFDELRARRGNDRHATMRALIAWSYDLLTDHEQALLLRLSQFSAPWRRPAVQTLGGDLGPELLDELVAKSLVVPDRDGHLRMLEPVREFCAARLEADPVRRDAARRALVDWACELVPQLPDDRDPIFDVQATRELVDQMPNIRRALEAALETGLSAQEAEIMVGLWTLAVDGRARSWFGRQIEDTLSRTVDPVQRRALLRLALTDTTEFHVDLEREERLMALLFELDPGNTSSEWGFVQSNRAVRQIIVDRVLEVDPNPTRRLLESSAEVARSNGRRLDEGLAHLFTSFSYLFDGEHLAALAAAERAADTVRQVNFAALAALADSAAALALEGDGDFQTAVEIAEAAVPLAKHARWETSVRAVDALVLARVGRHEEARTQVVAIIELALAQPLPFLISDAAIALAAVRTTERDLRGAAEAMDLAGVGRTPLTIAMMFEMAREMEFDLGFDRFVESLDPDAVARRADRAAGYLRSVSI